MSLKEDLLLWYLQVYVVVISKHKRRIQIVKEHVVFMLKKNTVLLQSLKDTFAEILWCPNIPLGYKHLEAFLEVPIQIRH